jgi:hypothetical protein
VLFGNERSLYPKEVLNMKRTPEYSRLSIPIIILKGKTAESMLVVEGELYAAKNAKYFNIIPSACRLPEKSRK